VLIREERRRGEERGARIFICLFVCLFGCDDKSKKEIGKESKGKRIVVQQ
jgi:hypothetical protein